MIKFIASNLSHLVNMVLDSDLASSTFRCTDGGGG